MCLAKLHWQCSRAAHATAGYPAYPGCAQRQRVSCRHGTAVQMGDLLFRGRRVLEPGRRGHLRIYDQSADRPLLYARAQYYRCPCPRGAVWRLRHARLGVDALLLACDEAGSALVGTLDPVRVLGDQHGHDDGDPAEPTTDWPVADVSVGLHGYWSARSPEYMQTGVMQFLRWMRMAGDTIFAIGAVAFGYFVLRLIFRNSKAGKLTERQTWQARA